MDDKEHLLKLLDQNKTVYCTLRHVSKSGMMRVIDLHAIYDNELYRISGYAARLINSPYNAKYEGIKISGCGMDMGFALVYDLSLVLYENGYTLKHSWI